MGTGALVLGIDGGGSRSRARLWVGGEEVASSAGGALNPNHVGAVRSAANLAELLTGLRTGSSFSCRTPPPDAACIGLSGVSHPASRTIVRDSLETAGFGVRGPRILVGDVELVLEAAFGAAAPSGVVLVCGTGSIALARDAEGRLVRAGGEGPGRGDAGGGAWIAGEAVAAGVVAARAGDGPPLASLVPEVVAAARGGDARARGILARAAAELGALARQAAAAAALGDPFDVRASGGVVAGSPELVALLERDLASGAPRARLGPLVLDPVAGALALATRALAAGRDVPPGW